MMNFQKILHQFRKIISLTIVLIKPARTYARETYSQCGEDLLVMTALNLIKGNGPYNYLDIGANDPYCLSNTALLYKKGGYGFLLEPNPALIRRLKFARGDRDKTIHCGISFSSEKEATLFVMDANVLSTFSRNEAERYVQMGHKIVRTVVVPMKNINELLELINPLDFMNLDVEGVDEKILRSINWFRYRPLCICVETVTYEKASAPKKLTGIIEFLLSQDYMIFADTFINTIFVDRRAWESKFPDSRQHGKT